MMISSYLRLAAILAFCGLFSACAHHDPACAIKIADGSGEFWCAPNDEGHVDCFHATQGSTICPIEFNVVQCFFYSADLQLETKHQARILLHALKDVLELPVEELIKPRYADYHGNPNQGTLIDILNNHYVSFALIRGWGRVSTKTDGFLPALKLPESIPVIKERIREAEMSLDSAAGD